MEYNNNDRPTADAIPQVLTIPELASFLKIGRNAAYDLAKSGQIRTIKIGKSIRISRAALQEYLAS